MLRVPEQLTELAANFVRTYTLSQFAIWRPIAFRFESKASMMSTDLFVDKPSDINMRLSGLKFDSGQTATIGDVIEERYDVGSSFGLSELRSQSKLTITGENTIIARAVSNTKLTVFYAYDKGVVQQKTNQSRKQIFVDSNTVVFASRHTDLSDLKFAFSEPEDGFSTVTFSGCDDKLIAESLSEISKMFAG